VSDLLTPAWFEAISLKEVPAELLARPGRSGEYLYRCRRL